MITVQELMSEALYTLSAHDTIHTARELMLEKRIRHVPIVDEEDNLVGLLTKHDVLAVSLSTLAEVENEVRDELEEGIPIGEVMITDLMVDHQFTGSGAGHARTKARLFTDFIGGSKTSWHFNRSGFCQIGIAPDGAIGSMSFQQVICRRVHLKNLLEYRLQ